MGSDQLERLRHLKANEGGLAVAFAWAGVCRPFVVRRKTLSGDATETWCGTLISSLRCSPIVAVTTKRLATEPLEVSLSVSGEGSQSSSRRRSAKRTLSHRMSSQRLPALRSTSRLKDNILVAGITPFVATLQVQRRTPKKSRYSARVSPPRRTSRAQKPEVLRRLPRRCERA